MYLDELRYKKQTVSIFRSRSRFFEMTESELNEKKENRRHRNLNVRSAKTCSYKYQVTNIDFFNDPKDGMLDYSKIINFGKCKITNSACKKVKDDENCEKCDYEVGYEELDVADEDINYIKKLLGDFNKTKSKEKIRNNCYIISMTKKESIPMWNYYADGDGVLIEFDLEKFIELFKNQEYFVGEVLYGKQARKKIVTLVKKYIENSKTASDIQIERKRLEESIKYVQLLKKRSEWKYEKEVRVIFKSDSFKIRNDSRFTRYIEIEMKKVSNAINEITISPMLNDSKYFKDNLDNYISLLSNKSIKTEISEIKIRDR